MPPVSRKFAIERVVVGADNFAVDAVPPVDPDMVLPCHQHLIMPHGVYLHEGMNLDSLAETGRYEFVYAFARKALCDPLKRHAPIRTYSPGMAGTLRFS